MVGVHRLLLVMATRIACLLVFLSYSRNTSAISSALASSLFPFPILFASASSDPDVIPKDGKQQIQNLREPSLTCSLMNNLATPEWKEAEKKVDEHLASLVKTLEDEGQIPVADEECYPTEAVSPSSFLTDNDTDCVGRVGAKGDIVMGGCTKEHRMEPGVPFDCDLEAVASPDMCYALVLAGGGNKGSYQAGVVKGLVEKYEGKVRWDVVAGVSVGALNAYTSRFFPPGQDGEWATRLVNIWEKEVSQADISTCKMPLRKNMLGFVRKLLMADIAKHAAPLGVCDNRPILNLSRRLFKDSPVSKERGVAISACRINDMRYVTFTDERSSSDQLIRAVMASAAVPGVFPPVEVDENSGMYYYDGGVINNANIAAAVRRCMDKKGVSADKVVVDYIDTSPSKHEYFTIRPRKTSIFDFVARAVSMLLAESGQEHSIFKAWGRYPGFRVRHYISPMRKVFDMLLDDVGLLDVTKRDVILRLIQEGIKDGRQAQCYKAKPPP
eukprot:GHVS01038842.1.p1 GENE.GHVS01038842.1~~GHVS01038842.1.p1  ORF type:complete len:499 (+),score=72.32 GHVS01038842.1:180-1676(+)